MTENALYDVAIIGGGLAGLSTSILFSKAGKKVLLLEKETYPFTKVCGEYISMESWDFLEELGFPLSQYDLPRINQLQVTAPNGTALNHELDLGGFGISRYFLDNELKKIAEEKGVEVLENTKVLDVNFDKELFSIKTATKNYKAKLCCGSFGKRSNLDVAWKRDFITESKRGLNNYIGIKYHVKANLPDNLISLHNFKDGYCGISKVEGDRYCLCYLTTAANLKSCNGDVERMEKEILCENKHLKVIFSTVKKLDIKPVTIAQISFEKKSLVHDHIIFTGDAAGMITPLCGNGMSMAMHSAKLFYTEGVKFLNDEITREQMEKSYTLSWNKNFAERLSTGRNIQRMFGKIAVTNIFISVLKKMPFAVSFLVKQTHGKRF